MASGLLNLSSWQHNNYSSDMNKHYGVNIISVFTLRCSEAPSGTSPNLMWPSLVFQVVIGT